MAQTDFKSTATGGDDRFKLADLPQTRRGAAQRIRWRAGCASVFSSMATSGAVTVWCAAWFGRGCSVLRRALTPLAHRPCPRS